MSLNFEIKAVPRVDAGKGASRRLRRRGLVPGIVYGAHKDPEMIAVNHIDLVLQLEHEVFYSHVLTLDLEGQKQPVVLKDLQRHPARPLILHLDLQRVSETEELVLHVPLHFVGEVLSLGVKKGGRVAHHLTDLEISCLPRDLPEFIQVDISQLDMNDSLHLADLKLPAGVSIPKLESGENDLVVTVGGHGQAEEEGTTA